MMGVLASLFSISILRRLSYFNAVKNENENTIPVPVIEESSWSDKIKTIIIIIGSGVTLGASAYAVYQYWKKSESVWEQNSGRRILMLGSDKSGKSTILSQVTSGKKEIEEIKSTEGITVTCFKNGGISLRIWEIGSGENVRRYRKKFLQDTDLLVFVVDASDKHNMSHAAKEVKILLGDDMLSHVPVLVLANKQDIPGALRPDQVAHALDLGRIPPSEHKVKILGTQAPPHATTRHQSIAEVEKALLKMSNDN